MNWEVIIKWLPRLSEGALLTLELVGIAVVAGLILARIVRHIVEAFLGALNLERLMSRAGVSIGEDSVIGAGSVVTRDIPAGVLAAGNPARVLRDL